MKQSDKMHVRIMVSDPWDFGTANGCGPFEAVVLENNLESKPPTLAIKLLHPLIYRGKPIEHILASQRLLDFPLQHGGQVPCNFSPRGTRIVLIGSVEFL